ncbi:hypothetical protein [Catellatospora sp. NPDC049609]|uniref:hypothetical protein n=1 Tax=Catellatospora sp. NPDC049609 TaxID=3155505 RepID=UPI0034314090
MSLLTERSGLDAVRVEFSRLLARDVLWLEHRQCGDLPEPVMSLSQVRDLMLGGSASDELADGVWRVLVERVRDEGGPWMTAAVGMALPGLCRAARRARPHWRGAAEDLEGELLTGFLSRLHTVDVLAPRICGRLIDAAVRRVHRAQGVGVVRPVPRTPTVGSAAPGLPWDHPDWVLARAVVTAVLGKEEAALIGATRLGGMSVAQAAAEFGLTVSAVRRWRRAAELRLRDAIESGELAFVSLRPRSDRSRRAVAASG